jgi:hypothetical protein
MPNVPEWFGHKYLGPGNPFPNGAPVDKADQTALLHDKFYTDLLALGDALNDKDFASKVSEADQKAIADFIHNFREDGDDWDWYSAAGAAGLSIKAAVERAIGQVLYPRKSSITGNGWLFRKF